MSFTARNKDSNLGSPRLEQSYSQPPYQLEPHEGILKRYQQSNSYPPILPTPKAVTHSLHQHNSEFETEDNRKTKRLGNIRACDICRRKKVKCVGNGLGSICNSCRAYNIECTYNESAKKRGPPKGYKADLNNRLKRLETLLGGLTNDKHTDTVMTNSGTPASMIPISHPSSPPKTSSSASSSSTSNLMSNSTSLNSYTGTLNPAKDYQYQQHLQNRCSTIEGQPRYVDDVGILPFLAKKFNLEDERLTSSISVKIRRLGKALVLVEEEQNASNGRTLNQHFLEEIGILKPEETVHGVDDWILKVAGITKKTSDQLMKIYFAYIHPGLPVVDKTQLLKQYRGLGSDYPPAPLLNAMYGAATRYIEKFQAIDDGNSVLDAFDDNLGKGGLKIPEGGSEEFYGRLMKYIKGIYAPSVTTVQAMVIAQNHRAGTENGMPCDWLVCAAAVRMAQDLGLQRSSENLDIPESEKQTRRRVWWAVYVMDRWAAASTGRPQTIFDEDCDQDYPSECALWDEVLDVAIDDKDDDQSPRFPSLDPLVAKNVKGEVPLYQPFVQIAKLSEILGRILQGLYTPMAKKHSTKYGSDPIVAELDKALSDWRAALPPTLQLSGTSLQSLASCGKTPLISISVLLYLGYCTLLILLHRPFIVRHGKPTTKSSESSLAICISAATRCVDVASSMQLPDFILVSWNFIIYFVFTASMIHGHTAIHSDSVTSDLAKSQLIKGLGVIKKLSRFSTKASQIHQIILQLMRARNLPLDNPLSDNDFHGATRNQFNDDSEDVASIELPTRKSVNNLEIDSQSVPDSMQHHHERSKDIRSNPVSVTKDNWINGLRSSFQGEELQASSINTNSYPESDRNSLQQFGLNIEQMFTPFNQLYNKDFLSNTTLSTDQSQQFSYAVAGLPQNFLFGLPSSVVTEQKAQQQNTTRFGLPTDTSSSSHSSQQYDQTGGGALPVSDDLVPIVDKSLFRNRPDNPFWSVPSSMEIDDWNNFLLTIPSKDNGNY